MLMDVLGTIIAFIAIILLLSILVTALVQATQALLRLRGRSLLWGVMRLVEQDIPAWGRDDAAGRRDTARQVRDRAWKVLNEPNVALLYHKPAPETTPGRVRRDLLGPRLTWADPEELALALEKYSPRASTAGQVLGPESLVPSMSPVGESAAAASQAPSGRRSASRAAKSKSASALQPQDAETDATRRRVVQIEKQTGKHFELQVRIVALVWSLAVAAAFQVSAPQLLSELAQGSGRRERILAEVPALLAKEKETLAALDYEAVAPEVIEQLKVKFPAHAAEFEQLSGVGTRREFVLDELRLVLKDAPDRAQVEQTYADLLDAAAKRSTAEAIRQFGAAATTLRGFDIGFWRKPEFFYDVSGLRFDALIGVIITAILLSFGAPFWFQALREVAALRDRLSPAPRSSRDTAGESER